MTVPRSHLRRDALDAPAEGLRLVVAAAVFACLATLTGYRVLTQLNVPGHPELPRWGLQDFRDATYYPARAFIDGENPYDEARYKALYPVATRFPLYAPIALLVHAPLALLPFETAEWVAFAVILLAVFAIAGLALHACGVTLVPWRVVALAGLILAGRPAQKNLFIGQDAATLALAAYLALLYARRWPWLAGAGLALCTIKPTYGGPLAALLLAGGERRAVAIGGGLGLVANVLPSIVLARASGGVVPLVRSFVANQANFNAPSTVNPATSLYRIDTAALFGRLLGRPLDPVVEAGFGLGLLAVSCLLVHRLARRGRQPVGDTRARTLLCLTPLICVYHQAYDLLLLTLPITSLVHSITVNREPDVREGCLALLLITPVFNYLPTEAALTTLGITGAACTVVASLNGALLLAAFVLCTAMMLLDGTPRHGDATADENPVATGSTGMLETTCAPPTHRPC